jgi:drug/metabolite transporter (DMT)-like permease
VSTAPPTSGGPPVSRSVLSTSAGTHTGAFTTLDWALFISIGTIWGSSFLFIAIGLRAFEPGLVTWLRVAFGAGVLWLVPGVRRPIDRADRPRVLAISILWVAVPMTLFPFAEQRISSGLAGLVNGCLPIFAAVVAALMLRRMPRRVQLAGLAVGFIGVVAIALPALGAGSSEAIGLLMVVVAVACYAVAVNIATPITQRYGSLPVMARMLALGTLWTAPLGLWSLPRSSFAWGPFLAVVALGMLGTGFAFVLMGRLVARVGSTRGSFSIYVTPVVALILGAVFLDESVHPLSVAGIGLVIAGAVLASRKEAPG